MIRYGAYAARQRMALDAPVAPPPPAPVYGPPGTIPGIVADVSKVTGVAAEDIMGCSRAHRIAQARHMAIYVAVRVLRLSPTEAATRFGREREAVNHALRLARDRIHASVEYAQTIGQLRVKHEGVQ